MDNMKVLVTGNGEQCIKHDILGLMNMEDVIILCGKRDECLVKELVKEIQEDKNIKKTKPWQKKRFYE